MKYVLIAFLVLSAVLFPLQNAGAFGFRTHMITAAVAEKHLTPAAKAELERLLATVNFERVLAEYIAAGGVAHEFVTMEWKDLTPLQRAVIWADLMRTTEEGKAAASYHYVPCALTDEAYTDAVDPEKRHLVAKIEELIPVLSSKEAPEEERVRALLWLSHLVGDLHMPLHVASNNDGGGSGVKLTLEYGGKKTETNLHALLDYGIFDAKFPTLEEQRKFVFELDTEVAKKEGMSGLVRDWARESIVLARDRYRDPENDRLLTAGDVVGSKFVDRELPIVQKRVYQAGLRLALVLNTALDKK